MVKLLEDRLCLSASFGFGWATQAGSPTYNDGGAAVTTDAGGNAYVIGDFSGTAHFGSGAGAATLTSAGKQDAFVAKYSPLGVLLWAKDIGGPGGYDYGRAIAVDGSGNVLITGDVAGTAVFGAGEPAQTTLTSSAANGGEDIFVARLDSTTGDLGWAEQFGGPVANYGRGLAMDTAGNVYVAGAFIGSAPFGTTSLSSIDTLGVTVTSTGQPLVQDGDTFTVNDGTRSVTFELDDDRSVAPGNVAVSFTAGESANQIDSAIAQAVNNANAGGLTAATAADNADTVYVAHAVTVSTVPTNPTNPGLAVGQGWSPFVAQLQETTGHVGWASKIEDGAPDDQLASGVAVSGSAVYLAGQQQHAPIGLAPTSFIAKLTTAGSGPLWVNKVSADVTAVAADGSGNVLSTGNFQGKVNFNPGGSFTLTSHKAGTAYNFDAFVWKLDANGNFVWAGDVGGSGSGTNTGGYAIAVDGAGNVYVTGFFNNTVNVNPAKGRYTLTAQGGSNAFVLKLTSAGQFVWAADLEAGATGTGDGIAVDPAGDVYTTGWFSGTGNFDTTGGTDPLTAIGTEDVFLSKLTQP
jgi:hypothetical protein